MLLKAITKLSLAFDYILGYLATIGCIIIAFLMFLITIDVLGRKFFGMPVEWSLEISELCLPAIVFLCAAWLLKKEGHVTMDMVANALDPKSQALLIMINSIIGLLVCVVITWYAAKLSINYIERDMRSITILGLPMFPRYTVIAFGSFLLSIQFLRRSLIYLKSWAKAIKQQRLSESPF